MKFTRAGQTSWTFPSRTQNWNFSLTKAVSSKKGQHKEGSAITTTAEKVKAGGLTQGWSAQRLSYLGICPGAKAHQRETSQHLY